MGTATTTCVNACVRPAHEGALDDSVQVLHLAVTTPFSSGDSCSTTSKLDEAHLHRDETGIAANGMATPVPRSLQAFPEGSSNNCSAPLQSSMAVSDSTAVAHSRSPEELSYEGTHVGNKKHGSGFLKMKGCTYQGDFQEDAKHGCGALSWDDGRMYVGQFCNGTFDGFAVMSWPDGRLYRGQYTSGYKHGEGSFSWHDGRCYCGQWFYGKRHGVGVYTNAKGLTRRGTWEADNPVEWEPIPMLHELEECPGGLALTAPVKAKRHNDHDPQNGSFASTLVSPQQPEIHLHPV